MPALTSDAIARLLEPYLGATLVPSTIYGQLQLYLELILKWNTRINLTAIRDPEQIVLRHFGESLFAGLQIGETISLLDLGSGAGFPGIPIQLLRPEVRVTLAEARARKAAFLREAVRTLGLETEVWAARAEAMAPERRFETVILRAVDGMDEAVAEAARRAVRRVVILGTRGASYRTLPKRFQMDAPIGVPGSRDAVIWMAQSLEFAQY